ncbi:MAG: hypothetical protein JWP24_1327, partial [Marmoricola sp.]|nr:hypothetical protein [Marmoricola sp.]
RSLVSSTARTLAAVDHPVVEERASRDHHDDRGAGYRHFARCSPDHPKDDQFAAQSAALSASGSAGKAS